MPSIRNLIQVSPRLLQRLTHAKCVSNMSEDRDKRPRRGFGRGKCVGRKPAAAEDPDDVPVTTVGKRGLAANAAEDRRAAGDTGDAEATGNVATTGKVAATGGVASVAKGR